MEHYCYIVTGLLYYICLRWKLSAWFGFATIKSNLWMVVEFNQQTSCSYAVKPFQMKKKINSLLNPKLITLTRFCIQVIPFRLFMCELKHTVVATKQQQINWRTCIIIQHRLYSSTWYSVERATINFPAIFSLFSSLVFQPSVLFHCLLAFGSLFVL